MAGNDDYRENPIKELILFEEEVQILTIRENQSVIKVECSHVIVRRHENEGHKMVVLNQKSEVCTVSSLYDYAVRMTVRHWVMY